MKMNRANNGTIVINKVNGKVYQIVSTDELHKSATAMEVGDDNEVMEDGDAVSIDDANAICFRVLKDAIPQVPQGYTLVNGNLRKDNTTIPMGELKFDEIIGEFRGELLLAATRKDGVDVWRYEPNRDQFAPVWKDLDTVPKLWFKTGKDDRMGFFTSERYETIEVEDEDGNKKEERVFAGETLLEYSDLRGGAWTDAERGRFTMKDAIVLPRPDLSDEHFTVFLPVDTMVNNEHKEVTTDSRKWKIYTLEDNDVTSERGITLDGHEPAKAAVCYPDRAYTLVTETKLVYPYKGIKLSHDGFDQLFGYQLVDLTVDEHTYKMSFANEHYQVKTVISEKTRDRGCIVTIQ